MGILTLYNCHSCKTDLYRGRRMLSEPAMDTLDDTESSAPSHYPCPRTLQAEVATPILATLLGEAPAFTARVVGISDGDTLTVLRPPNSTPLTRPGSCPNRGSERQRFTVSR